MTAALVAGLLAGYGIAVPVGAVAAYLVTLTARTSWRVGIAAAGGVATADGLYALVAVLGGAALAGSIRAVAQPLRWTAAVVLLGLAGQVAVSGVRSARWAPAAVAGAAPLRPFRAFVRLLAVTLVNPTTVVYFTALVTGARTGSTASAAEQAVFVGGAFAASASWQVLLATGGAVLGGVLTSTRGRLVTAVVSAAVIAALAVRVLGTR